MARLPRQYSASGYYHVILRGVNKCTIFVDDYDCERFLSTLNHYMKQLETPVIAYCLMGNHVHLLLQTGCDGPGLFMKCLEVSYVNYFNRRYDRTGHLFEDRYKCKPVDDDAYFQTVLRYILKNPEVAGISDHRQYRWSNYREFIKDEGWTDAKSIYGTVLEDENEFLNLMSSDEPEDVSDAELTSIKDNMIDSIVSRVIGPDIVTKIKNANTDERTECITKLYKSGLNVRQISLATGLNRGSVYYLLNKVTQQQTH